MIVLDQQLPHGELTPAIRRWYRGRVCSITELRPGTIIKDEAIPSLLLAEAEPTFVTLNWSDFWQRTPPDPRFCLVCFTVPSECATEIPDLLRRVLRLDAFRTKAARMGTVARVGDDQVAYYRLHDAQVIVEALL